MTLLNHIGVLVILLMIFVLFLIIIPMSSGDKTSKNDAIAAVLMTFAVWIVLEAFYWTARIFF